MILAPLRATTRAVSAAGLTAGFVSAFELRALLLPESARWDEMERWRQRHLALTSRVLGLEMHVRGEAEHALHRHRARLVIGNHRSALDIVVFLRLFGGFMLSRADLARWPILGISARRVGTLFVERDRNASRAAAVRAIRTKLEHGASVTVFAEGTTFRGDEVRPFHAGAFLAGRGLEVDVLPVGVAYEAEAEYGDEGFGAHVVRVAQNRRTRVAIAVGSTRPLGSDPRRAAEDARREVQSLVSDARELLDRVTGRRSG